MDAIDEGPSEEFSNLLKGLFETTCSNGDLRHSKASQLALLKIIAGHSYSKVTFVLTHFLTLSSYLNIPFFTWLVLPSRPTASHLMIYLKENAQNAKVEFQSNKVVNFYLNGHKYSVNLYYITKNLALMDLIVEIIGFSKIETFYKNLGDCRNPQQISTISNQISQLLYQYLKFNFPSQANQIKARALSDFALKHRCTLEQKKICLEDIDDDLIIEFWLSQSTETNSGFRLYQNCVQNWIKFRKSIRKNLNDSSKENLSLDALNEDGFQIDEKKIASSFEIFSDETNFFHSIEIINPAKTKTVKLVNKIEFDLIGQILKFEEDAKTLIITLMRALVFCSIQSKLVEFSRKNPDKNFVGNIISEISPKQLKKDPYREKAFQINDTIEKLQGIAESASYSLLQANSVSFIYVMPYVANRNELTVFSSKIDFSSNVYKDDAKKTQTVQNMSEDILDNMGKLFPDTLKRLKQSKKKFRRKGLDSVPEENLDLWTSEIVAGVEMIYKLIKFLRTIQEIDQWKNLLHGPLGQENKKKTWNYENDYRIFSKQFATVYGGS